MSRRRPKPSDSAVRLEHLWGEAEAELAEEKPSISTTTTIDEQISVKDKNEVKNAVAQEAEVIKDVSEDESVEDLLVDAQAKITSLEEENLKLKEEIKDLISFAQQAPIIQQGCFELSDAEMWQFSKLIRHPARFAKKTSHSVSIIADDARVAIDQIFHTHGISPLDAQHLWNLGMILVYVGLNQAVENNEQVKKLQRHYEQTDLLAEIYSILLNVAGIKNPFDLEALSKKMS